MTTPNLQLPEVPEAILTASDELNAGLWVQDSVVQLSVISRAVTAPPSTAVQGNRYLIPAGATGAWAARTNHVAYLSPTGWLYFVPRPGWLCWSVDDAKLYVFTEGAWAEFSGGGRVTRGATWVKAGAGGIVTPVLNIPLYFSTESTISGVSILTQDDTGSCVVDILKGTFGSYPTSSSICAAAKPTIVSGTTYLDTTLTGWTTTVAAGDFLLFVLDSSSGFKLISCTLTFG